GDTDRASAVEAPRHSAPSLKGVPEARVMGRHPQRRDLERWFDGESSADLSAHIDGCWRCRDHVASLTAIGAVLRGAPAPVSARVRTQRLVPASALVAAALAGAVVTAALTMTPSIAFHGGQAAVGRSVTT